MANRGEWSEVYAFAWILLHGSVPLADSALKASPSRKITVKKVFRGDKDLAEGFVPLSIDPEPIPDYLWLEKELALFHKEISSGKGTFEAPAGQRIMKAYGLSSIKAASDKKIDLVLEASSLDGSELQKLGYSVKSRFGGSSTLLNASSHTRLSFYLEFNAMDRDLAGRLRELRRISDRVSLIESKLTAPKAFEWDSPVFVSNLEKVDTGLPTLLAELLWLAYSANETSIPALVEIYSKRTGKSSSTIELIIKRFLLDVALGMVPGKAWQGTWQAYGGYLIVQPSGEVVAFTMRNFDEFKSYLYQSSYVETPSTSRHEIGELEREGERDVFRLSAQIRFVL